MQVHVSDCASNNGGQVCGRGSLLSEPRVAVVIPVFKQPSLVIEAIESVLRQRCSFDYRVVVVNDGCPYQETDDVCAAYSRAYPDRIRYVRRRNGGLSAARNTGVDIALRAWPSVEAIQMLDADDRVGPAALELSFAALRAHPDASWSYPNSRRFGFGREYVDVSGPWSPLEQITSNYVMCASMIRRSVFERGHRYDEQMRLGYEDWDFWITLTGEGLRGVHVPDVDFQYRKRAESMLSESGRVHDEVMAYIRRKHAALFTLRRTLAMEHEQTPRYAVYLADERCVLICTDPDRTDRWIPLQDVAARLSRLKAQPLRERFPLHFVVTTRAVWESLRADRVAAGLLWLLQTRLELTDAHLASVFLDGACGLYRRLTLGPATADSPCAVQPAALLMLSTHLLIECLRDPAGDWVDSLATPEPQPRVDRTRLGRVSRVVPMSGIADAHRALANVVRDLRQSFESLPTFNLAHGKIPCRPNGDSANITRRLYGSGPIFPYLADASKLHAGFVLPVCEFGGAERVTMNLAREARRRGWAPHLFVLGSRDVVLLKEFESEFETLTIVESRTACSAERLLGLLGTMNVVIANNCGLVNPALGLLRRMGVKTFAHLHSVSINRFGCTHGEPYEALRYEHTFDGVICVSQKLLRWFRSWGFPEAKLHYVPNAPSFAVGDELVRQGFELRAGRPPGAPLNVLYLGRFDREKGLDRLSILCRRSLREHVAQWRVVGRQVVAEGAPTDEDLRPMESLIEPPAMTAMALANLYGWADVVVMVSRFEGAPLTILEAQRFGCVVLSTNVGAIDELIDDGHTGFLFDNSLEPSALADAMLARLRALAANREQLLSVAHAGAVLRRTATWARGFEPFAQGVERMVGKLGAPRD